jgi:DNA-binding NarL/FixJ family response regulator
VVGLAAEGQELLEPDVVIVDIGMPPTQYRRGVRAAKTIRQEWPATGILALSRHVNAR